VGKYSLQIKRSAQKELDALPDTLFVRIDRKILALTGNPRPSGGKKLKGYRDQWRIFLKISSASGWVTGAWCTSSTTRQSRCC